MLRSLLACLLAALAACSSPKNDEEKSQWRFSTSATRLADEFRLTCENGVCPASTGLLVAATNTTSGICTTWVAGEFEGKSVVGTNKHCVDSVWYCDREVAVRFPRTGEAAQCQRTLQISEFALEGLWETYIVPDYAFLLLDRRLREPAIPLSQAGLAPLTSPVTLRKAWVLGDRAVEMREERCSTGTAGYVISEYKGADSPNVSIYGCKIKKGVSGSPLLNPAGQVAAIVQIVVQPRTGQRFRVPGMDLSDLGAQGHGIATNLACVRAPELGLERAASCPATRDYEGPSREKYMQGLFTRRQQLKAVMPAFARFVREDKTGMFAWTTRTEKEGSVVGPPEVSGDSVVEVVPKCVLRPEDPVSRLVQNGDSIEVVSPGWIKSYKADRYGALTVLISDGAKRAIYSFDRKALAVGILSMASVSETANGKTRSMYLPFCPLGTRAQDLKDNEELLAAIGRGDDAALDAIDKRQGEREKGY